MKNFIQDGRTITVTLAAAILSGAAMLIGALVGVAVTDGAIGDKVAFNLEGVYTLPKAAVAISLGVVLYWDDTAKVVTTSSASGANFKVGHAFTAQLSGDATVQVKLSR
jgi:predicted RecA/RadA family phage recombinase